MIKMVSAIYDISALVLIDVLQVKKGDNARGVNYDTLKAFP